VASNGHAKQDASSKAGAEVRVSWVLSLVRSQSDGNRERVVCMRCSTVARCLFFFFFRLFRLFRVCGGFFFPFSLVARALVVVLTQRFARGTGGVLRVVCASAGHLLVLDLRAVQPRPPCASVVCVLCVARFRPLRSRTFSSRAVRSRVRRCASGSSTTCLCACGRTPCRAPTTLVSARVGVCACVCMCAT
jgi:hypothetical protein